MEMNIVTTRICVIATLLSFNATYALQDIYGEQRNGFFGHLGFGYEYFTHVNSHYSAYAHRGALDADLGYILKDYIKISLPFHFGSGQGGMQGESLVPTSTPLSTLRPNGIVTYDLFFGVKFGYNLSSLFHAWNYPLYLNFGLIINTVTLQSIYTPLTPLFFYFSYPIELDGAVRINQKWQINYLVSYSYVASQLTINNPTNSTSDAIFRIGNSYELQGSLGFSYRFAKKALFFAKVYARYYYTEKTGSTEISTGTQTDNPIPGIKYDTTASIYYPSSHTLYSGVQIGFGF